MGMDQKEGNQGFKLVLWLAFYHQGWMVSINLEKVWVGPGSWSLQYPKIYRAYGKQIELESQKGRGTKFFFTLELEEVSEETELGKWHIPEGVSIVRYQVDNVKSQWRGVYNGLFKILLI